MSAKALKAVDDAMIVAARLESEGRRMEAEAIRRLCRSNSGYRTTLNQLWTDNMGLRRAHAELWKENCELTGRFAPEHPPTPTPANPFADEGDPVRGCGEGGRGQTIPPLTQQGAATPGKSERTAPGNVAKQRSNPPRPYALEGRTPDPAIDFDDSAETSMVWCEQCDRRVGLAAVGRCVSRFCKAKALAA